MKQNKNKNDSTSVNAKFLNNNKQKIIDDVNLMILLQCLNSN